MKKYIEETKFEKIYNELMFEIQDVIDLLNHVLGQKSKQHDFLGLLDNNCHKPVNDNWPLYESQDDKVVNVHVK